MPINISNTLPPLAAVPLTSCNKKVDDIKPINDVLADEALRTSADVQAALVGAYDALSSNRLYAGYIQFRSCWPTTAILSL